MNIAKALVVDDSKVAHLTLRKLLTERNIEVDWVGSGEDAITYMERQNPDIIFMDVMMPGMDGFETTATITNNAATSTHPPIIMCSANASEEDKQNAKQCGATDFLSKPYTPAQMDQVLDTVRDLLGMSTQTTPTENTETPDHLDKSIDASEVAENLVELPSISAEPPSGPTLSQPANSAADLERIAERAAWAMADKVARDVATEIAKGSAEQAARTIAEQTTRAIVAEEIHKAIRTAVEAAQEAASKTAVSAAQNAASAVAQASAEKAVHVTLEQATREMSENILKRSNRGLAMIRDELTRNLEQRVAHLVPEAVGHTLAEPDCKQRLMPILAEAMHPMVETITRQAAAAAQQVAVDMAKTRKRTNLTLAISLLALIAAAGCAILSVVSF